MRDQLEHAASEATEEIESLRNVVRYKAENTREDYEDIVLAQAQLFKKSLEEIDQFYGLKPGTSIALALLRVGVRI